MRRELVPAFRECTRALRRMDTEWAIGGAEAMAAHGFQRETLDVDFFIGDDAREDLIAPRFEREVARLVQRNINTVALAFVDTRDLYLFRSQERVYPEKVVKKSRVWKPLPPNWVIVKK